MLNEITPVLGFDGLHRSGKGTQIALLAEDYSLSGRPYRIVRGDGTRKGLGKTPDDPISQWWQENYSTFFSKNRTSEENKYLSDLVFSRLMHEAQEVRQVLDNDSEGKGILFMDRTFISHWFVKRQQDSSISLEQAIKLTCPENGRTVNILIPNISYVFYVPKEELIRRVSESTDSPEKKEFRLKNISIYFDEFERLIDDIPSSLNDKKILILDGNRLPEEIHREILATSRGI